MIALKISKFDRENLSYGNRFWEITTLLPTVRKRRLHYYITF